MSYKDTLINFHALLILGSEPTRPDTLVPGDAANFLGLLVQHFAVLRMKINSVNQLGLSACTKQPIRSNSLFQACKILGERDAKGYGFECFLNNLLLFHRFKFESNPLQDPHLWKKNIGSGPDLKISELDVEIEAKNVYTDVWIGSIVPHYINRFSDVRHKLVVINDRTKLPSSAVETLRHAGVKVLNPIMLVQYLYNLLWKLYKPRSTVKLKANSITRPSNTHEAQLEPSKPLKPATGPPWRKIQLRATNLGAEALNGLR